MDVKDLSDDELDYELELRRVAEPKKLTRKRKVDQLKALMRQEHVDLACPQSARHFISDASNIYYCQQKLQRLGSSLLRAFNNQDVAELKQCLSKYYHYRARITLITDPVYAPYVQQAEKVINDSLDQITQCLQSLTYVSVPDFSREDILPEEEDILNQLKDQHLQSSSNGLAEALEEQPKAENIQAPLNLSRNSGTGVIPKTSGQQHGPDIPPPPMGQQQGLDIPPPTMPSSKGNRLSQQFIPSPPRPSTGSNRAVPQFPQLQQSLRLPVPPPRPSMHRQPEQPQHPLVVGNQQFDIRDEVIRYLLANRHQPDGGAEQSAPNGGRWTPNNNRQRYTQPIFKWPFSYAGNQDILELAVFLNRVKTYADTEDVDEYSLLRGIKHLLRDRALEWYTRNYNRFNTWDEFKDQIKAEFLPPSSSQLIKRDLYVRQQGEEETFTKYYQDLLARFQVIEPPLSPGDKLFFLKSNLNSSFAPIAAASQSIAALVATCRDYDSVFLKKIRSTRSQRMVPAEHNRATPSYQRFTRPTVPSSPWTRAPPARTHQINVMEEEELDVNDNPPNPRYSEQVLTQGVDSAANEFREEAVNAVRSQGAWTSHQTNNIPAQARNSPAIACWQCEQAGHVFTACRNPKTFLFCYRCGKKGFTSRNCCDCLARMTQALPDAMINSSQGNAGAGFQN